MIKSAFTYCQVLVYLLLPTFLNSAFALDIPQNDTPTYTHELEPFPSDAYQIAKATFLPEVQDSDLGWGNNTLKMIITQQTVMIILERHVQALEDARDALLTLNYTKFLHV